jgi:predicted flavoprotein YhiN
MLIKNLPLTITGTEGFGKAMVTKGGVNLDEIYPRTLESKRVHGLFFAGEILDVDAPCGGFNLQWAFSSGFLAAQHAMPDRSPTPKAHAKASSNQ